MTWTLTGSRRSRTCMEWWSKRSGEGATTRRRALWPARPCAPGAPCRSRRPVSKRAPAAAPSGSPAPSSCRSLSPPAPTAAASAGRPSGCPSTSGRPPSCARSPQSRTGRPPAGKRFGAILSQPNEVSSVPTCLLSCFPVCPSCFMSSPRSSLSPGRVRP